MGSQFQVPQAHQKGSFELPTAARNASTDDSVVHSDTSHSQVCGHETNAQRIPGRSTDLNPMAPGHFCQDIRELGALQFGEQVTRQRADSAGGNAPPAHGPSAEPIGQCLSTEAAELIRILTNQVWSNPGNHCYIVSVLRAQLWACLMCDGFSTSMWGTWTQHLTSMLTDLGTQPLTLTDHAVLGEQLLPWLQTHDVHSQQDAAEFAGWLRGQLFD